MRNNEREDRYCGCARDARVAVEVDKHQKTDFLGRQVPRHI